MGTGRAGYDFVSGSVFDTGDTVQDIIRTGELSKLIHSERKSKCPNCGHECDVHGYHRYKYTGVPSSKVPMTSIDFMDCDCGYAYVSDRATDWKVTRFTREPGLSGTILTEGKSEEIVLNAKQTQRIVDRRLVYAIRAEGTLEYRDSKGAQAVCHIERTGNLVIATELEENKGISVSNDCVTVAEKYAKAAGIDFEDLIFVLRYDTRSGNYPKTTLDRITFKIVSQGNLQRFYDPSWYPMTEEVLDRAKKEEMF